MCLETYEITFIHTFGPLVSYVNMKSTRVSNENKMAFTYNAWGIEQEPIFVNKEAYFSFEELRREVSNSEFYFELIQELVEKDINQEELTLIQDHFGGENTQLAFLLIYMGRLSRSFIYWYFTKATKANGSVFIRREIPALSDPLKFAIALDFMKKNDPHLCF